MSITNYGELKAAVENWLGTEDLTNRIPEWIALAEDRIAQDLRVSGMETTGDLTISAQSVSVPTGFIEVIRLYLDQESDKRLDFFTPQKFWSRNAVNETAKPEIYTLEGDNFMFAPTPDATYTGKLLYYKRFTDLSDDADTNWIISNARGLLLYGALLDAHLYLEDDAGATKYASLYEDTLERVHMADRRGRFPKGGLAMHSEVPVI